jgi:N-acetylmuramoyl-L-alanine amidase
MEALSKLAGLSDARRKSTPWLPAVLAMALFGLSACSITPESLTIDHSLRAQSQSSRVDIIVLHYTSAGKAASLQILTRGNVSSHYLITDDPAPRVYQLVDETRRAWHAGSSSWYGQANVNSHSIGIEIVNPGHEGDHWAPYSDAQIHVLKLLLRRVVQRHQIEPRNIVGHSDIAPLRKFDPGPLFPWRALAAAGLGRWYDEAAAARNRLTFEENGMPDVGWMQRQLARIGYDVPQTGVMDAATQQVLAAFQMHYRPGRFDGAPDLETLSILGAMP